MSYKSYHVHGDDHYSYDTAIRTVLKDGRTVGNVTNYSRTTNGHQAKAQVFACDLQVANIPRGTDARGLRIAALSSLLPHPSKGEAKIREICKW